jgi:hypothetical protein
MQSISMTIQNGQALFPKAAQNDYIKTLAALYKNSPKKMMSRFLLQGPSTPVRFLKRRV